MPTHDYKIPSPAASVFRAYDIRGKVTPELINEDLCYALGLSIGSESLSKGDLDIVAGCDGRLTSPRLFKALLTGLQETGIRITNIGLVTSPMLYFSRIHLGFKSAVMLTASHSPKDQNGLKTILGDDIILDEKITNLYNRIQHKNFIFGEHHAISTYDIKPAYLKAIKDRYSLKRRYKIVVDCGNGATGVIAKEAFEAIGCDVIALYDEVDGNFPNHHPDPIEHSNLQDLQKAVLTYQADLGLAFDGDGDRVGFVDNQGEIIVTDRILMLLCSDIKDKYPPKTPVVFDVKCSNHLFDHIKSIGLEPIIWTTGHSRIKKKMQELNAPLAGEMSAHVFFQDNWYGFDDGIHTGARLLSIIEDDQTSFHQIMQQYQIGIITGETLIPTPDHIKYDIINRLLSHIDHSQIVRIDTVDGARITFKNGWGLIRASNTGPNLTTRFEGNTTQDIETIKKTMMKWLELAINDEPKS